MASALPNAAKVKWNADGSIDVKCGTAEGRLRVALLIHGRSRCVEVDGRDSLPLLSLNDFERLGGKGNNKKWKTSIKHNGKPLKYWIEKCDLTGEIAEVSSSVEQMDTSTHLNSLSDNCLPESLNLETIDSGPHHGQATVEILHSSSAQNVQCHVVEILDSADEEMELEDLSDEEKSTLEKFDDFIPPEQPKFEKYGKIIEGRFKGRLFPQQIEALNSLEKWFSDPEQTNRTAVVVMPTGSGKTGVICSLPYKLGAVVSRCHSQANIGAAPILDLSKPILIIAPDLSILDQLEVNLSPTARAEAGSVFLYKRGIINQEKEKHVLYTVKRVESAVSLREDILEMGEVILVNAQKWHTRISDPVWHELSDEMFSCVIVDEAHHLPAKMWKQIVRKFQRHAKISFFTATPYRADKKKITDDIETHGLAYHLERSEAIEQRLIRNTDFIELPYVPSEVSREAEHLIKVAILEKVYETLMTKNRDFPLPGGRKHSAIAIAKDKSEAGEILQLWNERFVTEKADEYHSDVREELRKEILKSLYEGNIRLLIIVGMLLEGFDYPPISVAAIMTRIVSPVKFAQFIGRAQRVVRHQRDIEPAGIKADVITHCFFNQSENYKAFESECLIPIKEPD